MQSRVVRQRRPAAQRGQPAEPPQSVSDSEPSRTLLKHVETGGGSGVRDGDGQEQMTVWVRSGEVRGGQVPPLMASASTGRERVMMGLLRDCAHASTQERDQFPNSSPSVQLIG